jgi:hypothetical protein
MSILSPYQWFSPELPCHICTIVAFGMHVGIMHVQFFLKVSDQ